MVDHQTLRRGGGGYLGYRLAEWGRASTKLQAVGRAEMWYTSVNGFFPQKRLCSQRVIFFISCMFPHGCCKSVTCQRRQPRPWCNQGWRPDSPLGAGIHPMGAHEHTTGRRKPLSPLLQGLYWSPIVSEFAVLAAKILYTFIGGPRPPRPPCSARCRPRCCAPRCPTSGPS